MCTKRHDSGKLAKYLAHSRCSINASKLIIIVVATMIDIMEIMLPQ